ncbi:sulfotransferase family protein [Saccharothrix obliqua]|uniref:sulfotransferase family protein n=1 Tax=Saccharothrix obliqua TaxID=2861747 RepID=UPI001C5DB1F9|nr:sulfotransferase [Saccharothrix obliqua]MBW4722011.1 sulfotransferase [Saccharothrix obliqua]
MTTTLPLRPDPAFDVGEERFREAVLAEGRLRADDVPAVLASLERSRQVLADVAAAREAAPPPPVDAPVVVVGLLRTGTTLLHNLLSLHRALHGPRLWELADPVAAAGDPAGYPAVRAAAQAYVDDYNRKAPDLPGIHLLHADRPDECLRLVVNTFHSMVLEMRYRVPSYGEWLHRQDLTEPYRWHRHQLELLMSRRVDADGVPLTPVLKCPFHTWYLPELVAAYPRARFVHLHRDPAEAIASTASLCRAVRGARSDDLDLPEIGDFWRSRIVPLTHRLADSRDELVAGRPVLDVRYRDLVADTEGTLRRVLGFLDLPVTGEFLAAVRDYLAANGQRSRGAHRYSTAEFGLDADALRAATADYRTRFDV